MLTATVEQAAEMLKVTPKTIRQWIREEGLPVVREGKKGPGGSALVDMARVPHWHRERESHMPESVAEYFAQQHPDRPNPVRTVIELHHHQLLQALALSCQHWIEEPAGGPLSWPGIGLTAEQARHVAAALWLHGAALAGIYTFERFELDVADLGLGDLDDLASIMTEGDVRSAWRNQDVEISAFIKAMLPAATRASLDADKPSRQKKRGKGRA